MAITHFPTRGNFVPLTALGKRAGGGDVAADLDVDFDIDAALAAFRDEVVTDPQTSGADGA